jgi:5-formyltetrahydrofolate cyclo-ligase
MHMTTAIKNRKAAMREHLKAARSRLTAEQHAQYSDRIVRQLLSLPEIDAADTLFIYISADMELNTHTLINTLLNDGKTLAVPRILDRKTMVAVAFDDWNQLQPAQLGILAPVSSEPFPGRFDVIITPGLGFTPKGYRIGYGAGYYDRWFDRHPEGIRIAPAFDLQLVDDLPIDETDCPVHRIITEKRDVVVPSGC